MKFLTLLVFLLSSALIAHTTRVGDLRVGHSYAPATPPGAQVGAVYFPISNNGKVADKLIKVESQIASTVEMHTHLMDKGVMRMRAVPHIELTPESTVELTPGGLHLMLFGLKKPLRQDDSFTLTLTFEKAGKLELTIMVEEAKGAAAHQHHKH